MIKWCLLISLFIASNGFLLDETKPSQHPGQTGNNFLTLDDKLRLQHELDNLRYDQEKTVSLLASQLKQQLNDIRTQVEKQKKLNETYWLVDRYHELELNYTTLSKDFETLKNKNRIQEDELAAMRNKTAELEKKQQALEQLKGIQQLQAMNALQKQMQTVESSVRSLFSHEQARNQDFIALHNLIIQSRHQMDNFQTNTSNYFHDLRKEIVDQFRYNNETFRNLYNITAESRLQLIKSNKKVAMTACGSSSWITYNSNDILKFSDIKTNVGMTKIASFSSTGKFVCEFPGLYHLSVVVLCNISNATFRINKNGSRISSFYLAGHSDSWNQITTAVVVADLQAGDTLSVQAESSMGVYTPASCLTIFRL